MSSQMTIVGLGQIGASIGLALKERGSSLRRVGVDIDPNVMKAAERLGAVDQTRSLVRAVREADIVMLCLPMGELRETLKQIAPELKENAVVVDTVPMKEAVASWLDELLPEGHFHFGLVPALNPKALADVETGLKAARPDLFEDTVMIVDLPPTAPSQLESFALDLVRLIGAKPMLADRAESDGVMTRVHLLPQLTAAALLGAIVDQPGWLEGRKLAGRPFSTVTGGLAHYDDPESLKTAALSNRSGVVYALDVMIASLKGLRDEVERGDEQGLRERLLAAFEARERWLDERLLADWLSEGGESMEDLPDLDDRVTQMFLGGALITRERKRK